MWFNLELPGRAWKHMRIKGTFFFLESQIQPYPKEWGPSFPKLFRGPPTYGHAVGQIATKFCMVIKLDERKILQG